MTYSDFIGKRIRIQHEPYRYRNATDALEDGLRSMLSDAFGYPVAFLCAFDRIKVTTSKAGVAVSGIVRKCEADCG